MAETPGLVAVTKFVRPGSAVFASYINYMDRDEAVHGGEIHSDYSAYSEEYMGNQEKTTGLFSMDYDRLTSDTAQVYKNQFQKAQENGSLLWQTVISFDNKWLEELGIYNSTTQALDEARIQGMTRIFMKTLLEKEQLRLASWTAAIHYNTDNIHVHIAIVDPEGEREKVKDGTYAGEPKGTWNIRTIRYAKSAAVNELLELDQEMKQLNELGRTDQLIKTMNIVELNQFLEQQRSKGSDSINIIQVEQHARYAYPVGTFILTLIGVSLSSRKVRGGTGLHIGIGIALCFSYILFIRFFEEFAKSGTLPPWIAVWIPNVLYLCIAVYLYRKAPK